MQSKLFQAIEPAQVADQVRAGLAALAQLEEPTWRSFVGELPGIQGLPTNEIRQNAIDDQLQRLGIMRRHAQALTGLVTLIAKAQADPRMQDAAEFIAADLREVASNLIVSETKVHDFVKLVIDEIAPKLRHLLEEKRYAAGALPTLAAYATTVELRAQLERQFRAGDDLSVYEPAVSKLIPLASIRLRTDDNEIFVFQCDRQSLELFIERLGATLKELDALDKGFVIRGA